MQRAKTVMFRSRGKSSEKYSIKKAKRGFFETICFVSYRYFLFSRSHNFSNFLVPLLSILFIGAPFMIILFYPFKDALILNYYATFVFVFCIVIQVSMLSHMICFETHLHQAETRSRQCLNHSAWLFTIYGTK